MKLSTTPGPPVLLQEDGKISRAADVIRSVQGKAQALIVVYNVLELLD